MQDVTSFSRLNPSLKPYLIVFLSHLLLRDVSGIFHPKDVSERQSKELKANILKNNQNLFDVENSTIRLKSEYKDTNILSTSRVIN